VASALEKLNAIQGYEYTVRGRRRLGLIAQELEAVAPEAVISTGEDPKTLGVSYADIVALLVQAVNELSRR
jgi:hypothetical protein